MTEFSIDLIGQVAEVDISFIVDAFEEHNGGKIFLKILDFSTIHLSLQDINNILFL